MKTPFRRYGGFNAAPQPRRETAPAEPPRRGVTFAHGRHWLNESTIQVQRYDVTPDDMRQVAQRSAEATKRRQAESDQFFARLAMLVRP